MMLLPHVYQVGGPCKTHHYDATSYLLPAGDELVLIDCGCREGFEQLLGNIRALGFDPAKITRIYGTHGHYDHIGAAKLFNERFGTRLLLHEMDREQVEAGDSVRTTASLLYGVEAEPITVHETYADGDVFRTDAGEVTILHTPGHSMGSCCMVLEHQMGMRFLFAGDTLHGGYSPLIGSDEAVWRKSLARLGAMHFDAFTFGHCNPQVICDADERIRCLIRSFANYYSPWFKDFFNDYRY